MKPSSYRAPPVALKLGRRAALVGALSLACTRNPAAKPPRVEARTIYSGQLEDYVTAAGLRWLVTARPAKLAESQSFRPALELLLSSERLQAFAQSSGFSLESLPAGLIAGFDLGVLYMAELPAPSAAQARERFDARQLRGAAQRQPLPGLVVMSGLSAGTPVGLVTIDDRVLAYGTGDPVLWRVVEAYARGRLKAPPAFRGAALSGLRERDAPIAAYAPGPFDERWSRAAGGLLEVATAVTLKLTASSADHALLEINLHGDFAAAGAAERLRAAYTSLAGSSTGSLLGLASALDARASERAERVTLHVPLPITDVARSARAVTRGDVDDIFQLSPTAPPASAPTSAPDLR